jgi:hypothetical protein
MAKPKKPEHIQVGEAETKVTVGKHSNKLHIELTLSIDQEERLLKMLKKRKDRRPKK